MLRRTLVWWTSMFSITQNIAHLIKCASQINIHAYLHLIQPITYNKSINENCPIKIKSILVRCLSFFSVSWSFCMHVIHSWLIFFSPQRAHYENKSFLSVLFPSCLLVFFSLIFCFSRLSPASLLLHLRFCHIFMNFRFFLNFFFFASVRSDHKIFILIAAVMVLLSLFIIVCSLCSHMDFKLLKIVKTNIQLQFLVNAE